MPATAGTARSARAVSAAAACVCTGNRVAITLRIANRKFSARLIALAKCALDGGVSIFHGADGFK